MKFLNKEQQSNLSQLQSDLQDAQEKVESAINDFNANINDLWANSVTESLDNYNKLVQQANEFVEETRDSMQTYYDERSEKWQEGERGQEFQSWLVEWDSTELEEIDVTMPEETDVPDFQAVEVIAELPSELD